jgi:butyrate kinase
MGLILTINPGNTSTKVGLFEDQTAKQAETIRHSREETDKFESIADQLDFRKKAVENFLAKNNIKLESIDYFIGRGGYMKPLKSGLYEVNNKMLDDLKTIKYGEHASNLGALIANGLASVNKKKAFILDPVCVDEFEPIARLSGHPAIPRVSVFHALNQKMVARNAARDMGRDYTDLNMIVIHLGSGISVGLHKNGRISDLTNAIDGEGPFSPERSGAVPTRLFLKHVFQKGLDFKESESMLYGKSGMYAYLGTNDFKKVMDDYEAGEDKKVKLVVEAMAYQIAKTTASLAAPVSGDIDCIAITGGLAYSETFTGLIIPYIRFITDNILIYPGEDELQAMAEGVVHGLKGDIEILKY